MSRLPVSDQGRGVAPELLPRNLDMFSQGRYHSGTLGCTHVPVNL